MEISRKQLLENIMANMGELHTCMASSRDGFLAQFELSRPQMELLFSIKHAARSTGELAKMFNITSSAVSQMVDQLERKQLVERVRDHTDRRITYIKLADEARKEFNAFREKFIARLGERFNSVTDKELETLQAILTKTIDNLKKESLWKK